MRADEIPSKFSSEELLELHDLAYLTTKEFFAGYGETDEIYDKEIA